MNLQKRQAKGVIILLSLLFLSLLNTGPAVSQHRSSARISSLGGRSVSGLIPDYITDLYSNPAYALWADGFTVNYGYRYTPYAEVPFTHFLDLRRYSRRLSPNYSSNSHEILLYGIGFSGWKLALSTQWLFRASEITHSDPVEETINYWSGNARTEYEQDYYKSIDEYWRIDLSAAHRLGDRSSIGLRAGGGGFYKSTQNRDWKLITLYDLDPSLQVNEEKRDDYREETWRRFSLFLEAGLVSEDDHGSKRGMNFRISKNDYYSLYHTYNLDIYKYYNDLGQMDEYRYTISELWEKRDGDLWRYDLWGRYTFPSRLKIFTGLGFGNMSFESNWLDTSHYIYWSTSEDTDILLSRTSPGDGNFNDVSGFIKIGKTYNIRDNIDLTAAFATFIRRDWSDDRASVSYTIKNVEQLGDVTLEFEHEMGIETETLEIDIDIPIAVEYRPSSYFSIFSGFIIRVEYVNLSKDISFPSVFDLVAEYYGIDLASFYGANHFFAEEFGGRDERSVNTSPRATIGFSLHYKDRLYLDIYSGSDITPDYITSLVIDARYTF